MRTLACSIGVVILLLFGVGLPAQENKSTDPPNITVADVDGNAYTTATIGSQVWMAEDLRTTRYRNGDAIGTTSPATLDISSESTPKYQWAYAGDESNVATDGRLYTWYAVTDSRNVCPADWHVPSDAEWITLASFLGGEKVAQGKLKEAGRTHWNSPNADATNETGFTALPGGNRWDNGRFLGLGDFTHWWTATEYDSKFAWRRVLGKNAPADNFRGSASKKIGWLVRCVRDASALPSANLAAQENQSAAPAIPAPAAISFAESGQQLNRLAGRGVALADFNGDGCLDAFVVNVNTQDGEGHRVYFGDCRGHFTDSGQRLANPSNWEGTPAIGDVNGDGKPDVVTGTTVWINDGKGHFTAHPELIEASGVGVWGPVKLADLNGDGNLDLVAVAEWRNIRVFLNDGKGHFHDTGQKMGSGIVSSLALGDVNGDGAIDIVSGGWRIEGSDYTPSHVWLNDGKGHFKDGGPIDRGENHVHRIALGDVNGDGSLDVVMACTTPGQAGKVYLNDGKGHFHDSGQILGHRWSHSIVLGDLDGDGSLDIFFANGEPETGTPNEVWLNDGKGNFRDSGLRLGNAFSWDVALGDLNGDGRLDAFVANLRLIDGSKNPPVFGGAPAEIWLNTTPAPSMTRQQAALPLAMSAHGGKSGAQVTAKPHGSPMVTGPYFGQKPPSKTPDIFAPGILSLPNRMEARIAFSPDGNECFFTVPQDLNFSSVQMYYTKRVNNVWTPQVLAPFSLSGHSYRQPFFSADGNKLYFTSDKNGTNDIWMVERTSQGWGNPQVLSSPINSAYVEGEYSQTTDGIAYFESDRPGGMGKFDIWRTRPQQPGQPAQVENLGPLINSSTYNSDPFISPDGKYLIYSSDRPGGYGGADLYVTFVNKNGGWTAPVNMNEYIPGINTDAIEYGPSLSPDGHYLFFVRLNPKTQQCDVWWVENPFSNRLGEGSRVMGLGYDAHGRLGPMHHEVEVYEPTTDPYDRLKWIYSYEKASAK